MRHKHIFLYFSIVIFFIATAFVVKTSTGKAGFAGNPGSPNCSFCHFNGTGITTTSITSVPAFIANQYIPNETYTINVSVSSTTLNHFGFDCVVLNDTIAGASNSGTVSSIGGSSQIVNSGIANDAVQINTASGFGTPSSKNFMFRWTAPSSGIAAFYASGLAVDNNGTYGNGDLVNTTSLVLTDTSSTGIKSLKETLIDLIIFPNPSTHQVELQYYLLFGGSVNAALYNIQGKELGVLFNENQSYGKHSKKIIYPNGIISGYYFIKVFVNEQLVAVKMISKL